MKKIEKAEYNVFIGQHELGYYEIFKTTFYNTRIHSFGTIKAIRLGLGLLKKEILNRMV